MISPGRAGCGPEGTGVELDDSGPPITSASLEGEMRMAEKSVSTSSLAMEDGAGKAHKGRKFRVAFIGCGGIAQTHMEALRQMPDVEVVAGVDMLPARLSTFKEKWGVTKLYKCWKEMLREVKPDGVSVCTPDGVHAGPAIDAANAGCHVFSEKPTAMNPAE
jgi:hypothetical protein